MTQQAPSTPKTSPAKPPATLKKQKPAEEPVGKKELARVREIILGPDETQQRMGQAEVDRLRQILFGPQIEEYERRFTDLQREMERVLGDLRLVQDTVSDTEKAQTKRIETLERETRRANDELRREVERLRAREATFQQLVTRAQQQEMSSRGLAEKTDELRDALAQQERDLRALRSAANERRDKQERKLDTLKREVRQAEDDLRDELRRVADRLGDQKTDRKALAAMLMEVAARLETGSTVTGLLEGLTTPARE